MRDWRNGKRRRFKPVEVKVRLLHPAPLDILYSNAYIGCMEILFETGKGPEAVYLYYFPSQKDGDRWPCKIGKATQPLKRITQQQASMQESPSVGIIWTENAFWAEKNIQLCLKKHKLRTFGNEWYSTSPEEFRHLHQTSPRCSGGLIRSSRQFGSYIRRYRTQAGLSQTELGKMCGLRQGTISLLENGNKGSRQETMFAILAALGLELTIQPRTKAVYPIRLDTV